MEKIELGSETDISKESRICKDEENKGRGTENEILLTENRFTGEYEEYI